MEAGIDVFRPHVVGAYMEESRVLVHARAVEGVGRVN